MIQMKAVNDALETVIKGRFVPMKFASISTIFGVASGTLAYPALSLVFCSPCTKPSVLPKDNPA